MMGQDSATTVPDVLGKISSSYAQAKFRRGAIVCDRALFGEIVWYILCLFVFLNIFFVICKYMYKISMYKAKKPTLKT